MKRAFMIHGWEGFPENHWFPWLKEKLEEKNFKVTVPQMPAPENPKIEKWVPFLEKAVGKVDQNTFFVGHSIGCQTILRYLERLPADQKVGSVILVAGWVHLTPETMEDEEAKKIAKPWLETPLHWKKIKSQAQGFVAIFSDDDPFVPIEDAKIFKENLQAKIIIKKNKGHFTKEDDIMEIPEVLVLFKKA